MFTEIEKPDSQPLIETPFGGRFCGQNAPRERISLYQSLALVFLSDRQSFKQMLNEGARRFHNHGWLACVLKHFQPGEGPHTRAFSVITNLRVDLSLKLYRQDKRDRVQVHWVLWVHLWRYVGWAWFGSIQCNWANIIYCLFLEKYKNIGVADGQSYGADSLCTFTIYGNKYKGRNKTGELFSPTYPGNIHCRGL